MIAPATQAPPSCLDPLELALPDGSCVRPGVLPDGCASGFEHDGEYGCVPVLPDAPCPPGLMATPGETECRPVMECGAGRWGDIPVDGTTECVDQSYIGMSDGSEAAPWTTVSDAVAAARPGALIAIAAGSYDENVTVEGKALRLSGTCPDAVVIHGVVDLATAGHAAALTFGSGSTGSEVRGVTLSGSGHGLVVSSEQVLADRIRVYDAEGMGIRVVAAELLAPTALTLQDSLVENNHIIGVFASGADVRIQASLVRATELGNAAATGIHAQDWCDPNAPGLVCYTEAHSSLQVIGAVIENNIQDGIYVVGSDAEVDATLIRGNGAATTDERGYGVTVAHSCGLPKSRVCRRARFALSASVVEQNELAGISSHASDVRVDASVVAGSDAHADGGIRLQPSCEETAMGPWCHEGTGSTATLLHSLVKQNQLLGLFVGGSSAAVEASVVRANKPRVIDEAHGSGVAVQVACVENACNAAARADITLRGSLVEDNHEAGVYIGRGSDATIEASLVRSTLPDMSGRFGDGVAVFGGATMQSSE